ncbi:MAG: GLPGLI family protein [Bacteroides sp.]|nr:GLPGLI family protein [Bacteroides sp.]
MKKTLIIINFLMVLNVICAQEVYDFQYNISYDMYINFGHRVLNKAELFYSNTTSCYVYKPSQNYTSIAGAYEDDERSVAICDTATQTVWCDKATNEIIELSSAGDILIIDSIPAINWEIQDDMRDIDGFRCNKAKCKFRGRTYTAWFSLDIPCNWGPWKLHGLPGAILEAYDDTNEISFYATSIHRCKIQRTKADKNQYKQMTVKEYLHRFEGKFEEELKRGLSKTNPGLQIQVSKVKIRSIELEDE